MASNSETLYVTFIDQDHDLLKVWGQKNRIGATYIERSLGQLVPEFNREPCPSPSRVSKGMFCFAKYTDDNYYRARIVSNVQGDSVAVLFIDYGNRDLINISNIRIQNGNGRDVIVKMAEQAEEFYLAGIAAPSYGWTKELVSQIRQDVCYEEFPYRIVDQVGDQKILDLQFRGGDLSSYLLRREVAKPLSLSLQKQMILSYCSLVSPDPQQDNQFRERQNINFPEPPQGARKIVRQAHQGNEAQHQRQPGNFSHTPPHPQQPPAQQPSSRQENLVFHNFDMVPPKSASLPSQNPHSHRLARNKNLPLMNPSTNPLLHNSLYPMEEPYSPFNNVIEVIAQQVKQYIAQDNAKAVSEADRNPHNYINSVLQVGVNYRAYISYIDDGPWAFSMQLHSNLNTLKVLMQELSCCELIPVKSPIMLGHACIAYSSLYKSLCRGVVVSISHSAVKVYFVDFGNTEDLPSSSIYELPPKFFKTEVLSQKFALCGLQKVPYSQDIKEFFYETLQRRDVLLRVTSLEDNNLPTCEIYVEDGNIKRILNDKIQKFRHLIREEYLSVNAIENVIVTWVESPQKFFVQLRKRDPEIIALKKELAEVQAVGEPLVLDQLCVGMKCVGLYEADEQWYRAEIVSIESEREITVFYVDYGNTEVVGISMLRIVRGLCLINNMQIQGIQCALKGFEKRSYDPEVASMLEALILEKELQMKVVGGEKEHLCVQLFDGTNDIATVLFGNTPIIDKSVRPPNNLENVWKSPTSSNESEGGSLHQKKDKYRGDKNKEKSNSSRQFTDIKSNKSQVRPTHAHPKKRFDEVGDNWRDGAKCGGKSSHSGDKISPGKSRHDKENDWKPDQKSWRNRGSKQEREYGEWGEKKEDGDRRRSGKNVGGRFEKKSFGDSRKRFGSDRSGTSNRFSGRKLEEHRSTRKPIKQEDAAPPGSKYEKRIINIGSSEKGIVTYYFSPDEFYIQLLKDEEEFKAMMHDIQIYYKDKYSLGDPVNAGDIVIAQFSLDKILYRAEVIKPSPVTVRYVDYGNQEPVAQKGTWLVDKKFLKLPKQVIKCRLSNIQPMGSEWPPPGCEIDKFFELEKYNCTFLGLKDDIYEISMEVVGTGKDVATEIIAAGLGQPVAPKIDVPRIDYSLLPRQVLRLYVSQVESPSKFYVVLNPASVEVIDEEIRSYIENVKNLSPLEKASLQPEMPCLSTRDSTSWHRGIIRKTDENTLTVWFSDRGDSTEVTKDKVVSLPEHLKVFQPQVAQCFLHDSSESINEEEFKKAVLNNSYNVSIVSADDQRLGVVLYDERGQKCQFHNDSPKPIEPLGHLPIISQGLSVMVSHVESPKEIHVQRFDDTIHLDTMSGDLAQFYGEGREDLMVEKVQKEGLVAAKSVMCGTWYRAHIVSSTEEGLEVFYLDYGNKEILPRENVRKLDCSFMNLNALSRKVSLDVDWKAEDKDRVNQKFLELTRDKEINGYFVNKEGEFICDFVTNGDRVTELLWSEGLVSLKETDKFKKILPVKKAMEQVAPTAEPSYKKVLRGVVTSDMKVIVSHIDSPSKFWVHNESEMNELNEFQDKLQSSCETLPEKEILQVNDIAGAVFLGKWYRVKVVSVDEQLNLQLLDYGKVFNTDLSCNIVKELPPELVNVPSFATCYALKGTWEESKTSQFEEIIVQSEEPVTLVILQKGDPDLVDLFQNGQSVIEKLKQEPLDESELCTVYITHINSPDDFYIQRESCEESYYTITDRMLDAEMFESVAAIQENEVYAAKSPDDDIWYRARAIKKHSDGTEVFFIDYGNISKVTEIKSLPEDLMDIPGIAENCRLVYGDTCDSWSEAACQKFLEFSDGGALKMKVVVNRVQKPIVRIFHEGIDVSALMAALCENDGRSEVYVSDAQSPTDFYIRYANNESYSLVEEKLENGNNSPDLEDKSPGSLCQASLGEGGPWRRAKILQTLDNGFEVFLIDFGNVIVSRDLRKLPPEIEEIPPLALRCSLNLPDKNVPESIKEEFINLTGGGETAFRARVTSLGGVNGVSLKLKGRILEETLGIDAISYENVASFPGAENHHPMDDETDDDKNSKINLRTDNYFASNLEDDAKAESSILNETDEEKRVKIAMSGGEEGFRSDDEKGISEGRVLSGIVNATDNELMEETEEAAEGTERGEEESKEEISIAVEDTPEGTASGSFTVNPDEENHTEAASAEEVNFENKTENDEASLEVDKENAEKRNKNKKVAGSPSRGEQEESSPASGKSYSKLKHSEKLVPGSISRGISLESIASVSEPVEETEERQLSQSLPCTPKTTRKENVNGYTKFDRDDRLVPGCISTGIPLECDPDVGKPSPAEKIVSGSVNGSIQNE